MKKYISIFLIFVFVFSSLYSGVDVARAENSSNQGKVDFSLKSIQDHFAGLDELPEDSFVSGRLLIKVDESVSFNILNIFGRGKNESIESIKESLQGFGILSSKAILSMEDGKIKDPYENKRSSIFDIFSNFSSGDKHTWYALEFDEDIFSRYGLSELIEKLGRDKNVLIAEPDFIYKKQSIDLPGPSTDPGFNSQWYHGALGITDTWAFLAERGINPGGSSEVVVAVIDTGIDYLHNDLAANMWVNPLEIANGEDTEGNGFVDDIHGVNLIDNNGNTMDSDGHGTHVAGIIAAAANNGTGGVGVAYNVKLMAIKASDEEGLFSTLNIARALNYAIANGADVINMSFGGAGFSLFLTEILQTAYESSILVAAAGNSNKPNESIGSFESENIFPAYLPFVIGVMASRRNPLANGDFLSSFSNWDVNPDNNIEYEVMAPGVQIYSTLPGNAYGNKSGTSMAAPIVSGVAALLRSYFDDKTIYDSGFIFEQITKTGNVRQGLTIQNGTVFSYRKVNSISAITNFLQTITGVVSISGSPKFGEVLFANISAVNPQGAELEYQWNRNSLPISGAVFPEYQLTQQDIGAQISVRVKGRGDFTGEITSNSVVPTRADGPPAPLAPVLLSKTYNSVTLSTQQGIEYRRGSGSWQTSGVFSGLAPETNYSFFARTAQTSTRLASAASQALQVKTESAILTSSKFEVNIDTGFIARINENTLLSEFLSNLTTPLEIKVFDNNLEILGNQNIGTGMTVRLFSDGDIFDEYLVVVRGDITGNGRIEPTDYIRMRSHLLGRTRLEGVFLMAGDIDGNGKFEPTDYIRMRAHLLGREIIKP